MKGEKMDDPLLRYPAYVKALELFDSVHHRFGRGASAL